MPSQVINHIENLDPAIIRPGQIDLKVEFGLANEAQIAQIFKVIYMNLEEDIPFEDAVGEKDKTQSENNSLYQIKISELATKFANVIPHGEFSPTEVQGYLLRWKNDLEMAVEKAGEWVSEARFEKKVEVVTS